MLNNTPISHAVELGAERIYILPTEDPSYRPAPFAPRTAIDAAIYGLRLLIHSRLEADIARCSPEVELIVLPAPNPGRVQPTNFEHAARLMIDARLAARAVLTRQDAGRHLRLAG